MNTTYQQKNLPQPDPSVYTNEFEKEVYICINLIRADPKMMIPQIKDIKKHKYFKG